MDFLIHSKVKFMKYFSILSIVVFDHLVKESKSWKKLKLLDKISYLHLILLFKFHIYPFASNEFLIALFLSRNNSIPFKNKNSEQAREIHICDTVRLFSKLYRIFSYKYK